MRKYEEHKEHIEANVAIDARYEYNKKVFVAKLSAVCLTVVTITAATTYIVTKKVLS